MYKLILFYHSLSRLYFLNFLNNGLLTRPPDMYIVSTYCFLTFFKALFCQVLLGLIFKWIHQCWISHHACCERFTVWQDWSGDSSVVRNDSCGQLFPPRPELAPKTGPWALGTRKKEQHFGSGAKGSLHRGGILPNLCTGYRALLEHWLIEFSQQPFALGSSISTFQMRKLSPGEWKSCQTLSP